MGGLVVGTILLLAAPTSLPELITSTCGFSQNAPNPAAGNLFGSNMVTILLLAVIDLINYRVPLIRQMAVSHTLTALLTSLLMLTAILFLLADFDVSIGRVGIESVVLIALYFGGVWPVWKKNQPPAGCSATKSVVVSDDFPTLRHRLIGFALAAGALLAVVPQMVKATPEIAEITGIAESFVDASMLSRVTSLPELLEALGAVRIGAVDLAFGNLFGSSVFNILGFGIVDPFCAEGRFLGSIDTSFAEVGVLRTSATAGKMTLVSNLDRIERSFLFIELDAQAIIAVYVMGMYLLYVEGL